MSEVLPESQQPPDLTLPEMFDRVVMTDGYVEHGITRAVVVIGENDPDSVQGAQQAFRVEAQLGPTVAEITDLDDQKLRDIDFAALAETDPGVGLAGDILDRPIRERPSSGHRFVATSRLAVHALFHRRSNRTSDTSNLADDIDRTIDRLTRRRRIAEAVLGGLGMAAVLAGALSLSNAGPHDRETVPTPTGSRGMYVTTDVPETVSWNLVGESSAAAGGVMAIVLWMSSGTDKRKAAYKRASTMIEAVDKET
jgi:hypothetical protein